MGLIGSTGRGWSAEGDYCWRHARREWRRHLSSAARGAERLLTEETRASRKRPTDRVDQNREKARKTTIHACAASDTSSAPAVATGGPNGHTASGAACPVVAGVFAKLNELRLAAGKPALGFLNPLIYSLKGQGFNPGFHDSEEIFSQFGDLFGELFGFGGGRRGGGGPRLRQSAPLPAAATLAVF